MVVGPLYHMSIAVQSWWPRGAPSHIGNAHVTPFRIYVEDSKATQGRRGSAYLQKLSLLSCYSNSHPLPPMVAFPLYHAITGRGKGRAKGELRKDTEHACDMSPKDEGAAPPTPNVAFKQECFAQRRYRSLRKMALPTPNVAFENSGASWPVETTSMAVCPSALPVAVGFHSHSIPGKAQEANRQGATSSTQTMPMAACFLRRAITRKAG